MFNVDTIALIQERITKYKQSEQHHNEQAIGCSGAAQALTELLTELENKKDD
jgi:exopolyphosphatase/pppGpp-phosphohydrolase